MTERTTVRLPEDLVRRAKRKAADEGRSFTSLIEDGLRRVLDDPKRALKAKRVLPRVSAAAGWLKPGIDLKDILETDDLDYVERMRRM